MVLPIERVASRTPPSASIPRFGGKGGQRDFKRPEIEAQRQRKDCQKQDTPGADDFKHGTVGDLDNLGTGNRPRKNARASCRRRRVPPKGPESLPPQ